MARWSSKTGGWSRWCWTKSWAMVIVATLPLLPPAPPTWVRVEDAEHPDAIARSARASLLERPPADGVRWRWASIPEVDGTLVTAGSEAIPATNAGAWHEAGFTGQGVSVAVFDIGWASDAVDLSAFASTPTHDCFASPTCEIPFDASLLPEAAGGPHGWACAEVVRALAPDAELHLVRVNALTTFENAVDWAIRNDIDVISMSMSYYNDSFYDGSGPHAPLVERLDRAGILLVTSAGNIGDRHWAGALDGTHGNRVPLALQRDTAVYLAWDQFDRCGVTDLDARIVGLDGLVIGASTDAQWPDANRCEPVERVRAVVDEPQEAFLEILHRRGPRDGLRLSVISRGGAVLTPTPGSTTDPAAHPRAVAVGAVPVDDYLSRSVARFSSFGTTPAGVDKPDIVGPDRLTTQAYGPGGFSGTSGSTPVIAGLVALVQSWDPSLTSREAYAHLEAWARDDPMNPDAPPLGAGRARLPQPEALAPAVGCQHQSGMMWLSGLCLLGLRKREST